ncbi:protein trichome birefringence-like 23 [Chenopodium quinoa]|uniref:protein trichome birefringence-like 23 n=1 Tax=Chenopodium quinoa TaxID=63459 RepID=UPI000B796ADD|nr:protein trichome birefringence-like 23 [Chenopodium quinoa]
MQWYSKMWALHKHKLSIFKLGVMILATTLALRVFLYNNSSRFPPDSSLFQRITSIQSRSSSSLSEPIDGSDSSSSDSGNSDQLPKKREKCGDLFNGDWIPNPAGPAYINETCNFIEEHQNCMKNGRPDSEYLYWRWSPRNCELPQFNAMTFLEMMENKTWAFIGDSISRNHVQSLICMLSKVEEAELFYHDEGYKSKGWRFPSYNVTVYVIWSPFLTDATIYEDINGVSTQDLELHLDRLDKKWTDLYKNLDYMIFSSGKWFLKPGIYYENETVLGCHKCQKNLTDLSLEFAYRKTLQLVFNFVATSDHKGLIFYRTLTPDHFEGGEWSSGGKCNRTVPFKDGEVEMKYMQKLLRQIELKEFESAVARASENGVQLRLLDFMKLSLLRPDGHPGPYRQHYPFAVDENAQVQYDCLHWCLPGPIDAWNDVIMEMIVNG